MRSGIGRASQEGCKQRVLPILCLHKPDEARAEHRRRCDDELAFEILDGGEGWFEGFFDFDGHGRRVGSESFEEEVVVVRHGGVVEYGCGAGIAGVL